MTRAGAALIGISLALLAACGSQQAIRATGHEHPDAAPRSVSASPPARAHTPPAPQALVTDEAQSRLLVVDLPGGRIARSVPLPPDPEDIAATANGGVAVVVSSQSGRVTVLNRDTLGTIKTFRGFDQPHIAAITPDYTYAYITDDTLGTLTAIDLYDMKVASTVHVGAGAHHLAVSPGEREIWVALGESARTIAILTTVDRTPPTGANPVADLGHPWVIGHLTPGFPVHDLSFSPDGQRVWITSAVGPDVTVFDANTRKALFRVPVGPPPQHLAVDGRYIYATSGYAGVMEKIDARTGHILARARAPYGSFELAAADGYLTTASLLRGTLAIYTPNLKLLRIAKLAPATREVAISRP